MTITQAAKTASDLSHKGKSHKEIAKTLARMGYISRRTGLALTEPSISGLIKQHRSGHTFAEHGIRKYRGSLNRYQSRKKTPMVTSDSSKAPTKFIPMPTVQVATNQVITRWDIAKLIAMSNDFTPPTKKALIDLIVDATLK